MSEDTTFKRKDKFLSISIRGWIALLVVITICLMSFFQLEVAEPLYTLGGMVVAYYYGQNQKQNEKAPIP